MEHLKRTFRSRFLRFFASAVRNPVFYRKQIEDDQQIRQLRNLGKEESGASESAHENGGTVQQRHVFPACFPLMFQTFF